MRALVLVLVLSGCSVAEHTDAAIVDARRAELVLTRHVRETLGEVSAIASESRALVADARPRVAEVLDDVRATTALLPVVVVAVVAALAAGIARRR